MSGPDRPLRVALVTETFPPEVNGVAMTTARLLHGLRRRHHQVQLICPRQPRACAPIDPDRVSVAGLPLPCYPGLRFGLPAGHRLHTLWQHQPPDLVHIVTPGPLGCSALRSARRLRRPVVAGFHTHFHRYSRHYRLGLLQRPILAYLQRFHNRCDTTLVPTEETAIELGGLPIHHLQVLARGVDAELFNPARRCDQLRRSWGASGIDPVVLYVGRLAPEKNLRLVCAAVAAMRRQAPRLHCVLVGDGPLRRHLQAHHPEFIFCGLRTGPDLARHYASADILLFASLTETFGNVTLEAMASGLAVVAFDYAAAHQLIEHGRSGLLAPPGDRRAFIDQAQALAGDLQRVRGLGLRARAAVTGCDWEHIIDRLERIYRQLLNRGECHGDPA